MDSKYFELFFCSAHTKDLVFQCFPRAVVKIVLQNAVFCGVSKIFYRSWDILQNFSKIVEKHMWKNLFLVNFGVYATEGLFKCNTVRDIFKGPLSRILLKVPEHLFSSHLLLVTAWKVYKYGVISGPYFPVFELNMEIYFVNLCIHAKYRKIRTRNNPVFGPFLRSGCS